MYGLAPLKREGSPRRFAPLMVKSAATTKLAVERWIESPTGQTGKYRMRRKVCDAGRIEWRSVSREWYCEDRFVRDVLEGKD
jgi:hypothetical protein